MLAALAAAVAIAGCSRAAPPPNVVLVTIDTLRADRCSFQGFSQPTTPFLAGLAAGALVFETAYSTSPWTSPSMASLFTGLPPRAHGVREGFLGNGRRTVGHDILDDRFATLAERLRARGYRTIGISTNSHIGRETGFAQGFDVFRENSWGDASTVAAMAEEVRAELERPGPWFLWVHYFDPHVPYFANEPYFKSIGGGSPLWRQLSGMSMGALERRVREQGASARRQLRPPLRLLYDGEIRRTDDALRALFEDFGIGEREVVVVTSDHGEAFFEHGVLGHGSRLFEEQLRVPLLVRLPGGAGAGRVELPVSGLDVLPTVLEAVGSEADPALPGRSLLGAASQPLPEVPVFFELMRRGESAEGVRLGRWKLYRRLEPSVLPSLYDVEGDRGETMDRRGAAAEASERLAGVLDAWNERWPVFAAPRTALPVSEEEVEKLEALGYGS